MAEITKPKFDFQLVIDKLFRRKVFLDPQPDGSFKAITINGLEKSYFKDEKGATAIHPARLHEVRGLKNVKYIGVKRYNMTELSDMFGEPTYIVCPTCQNTVWTPEGQMTEKMFADMIDIAESAGRLQAERENNPAAGSQMKMLMLLVGGVGVLVLWMIMKGG